MHRPNSKSSTSFRCYIEEPDDYDSHTFLFDELAIQGYDVEMTPITLDGKIYDFFFHKTLKEAHEFCESLGYEINTHFPNEGLWKKKLFPVK